VRKIELLPITRSLLIEDLKKLKVSSDDIVMLHASVKSIGWELENTNEDLRRKTQIIKVEI